MQNKRNLATLGSVIINGAFILLKKYKKHIFVAFVALIGLSLFVFSYLNHPKRYAVFAGYNADGTIHPYVITYLKGLKEVSDGIVYIADSALKPEEEEKLKPLTIHYENIRHQEYDWGSYKRGFNWLKENGYLEKADELIFANDSCYAPITSFKPMFKTMDKRKDLDFWGDLKNIIFSHHLQSYFFVFRKKIIQSEEFAKFLNSVTHQDNQKAYILKYEVRLTPYLEKLGYKWDTFMPYDDMILLFDPNKTTYPLTLIKKYNHQFIKRRIFTIGLPSYDDLSLLLRYLHKVYPERYQEIITEIPPAYIPKDLQGTALIEPTYLTPQEGKPHATFE